jgi:hypothetical protein
MAVELTENEEELEAWSRSQFLHFLHVELWKHPPWLGHFPCF